MTAAAIARLAGVGRAAVSNWRKRHPDFPHQWAGSQQPDLHARRGNRVAEGDRESRAARDGRANRRRHPEVKRDGA